MLRRLIRKFMDSMASGSKHQDSQARRSHQYQPGKFGSNDCQIKSKSVYHDAEKTRRTNKIDFLQLPWAQEVWSSNFHAPTNSLNKL